MSLSGELRGEDSKTEEERSWGCGICRLAGLENTGTRVRQYLDERNSEEIWMFLQVSIRNPDADMIMRDQRAK